MIELIEGCHVVGLWMLGNGRTRDWLCVLYGKDDAWITEYRFRHYDGEVLEKGRAKEEKNWQSLWSSRILTSEKTMIELIRVLQAELKENGFSHLQEELLIQSDHLQDVAKKLEDFSKTSKFLTPCRCCGESRQDAHVGLPLEATG